MDDPVVGREIDGRFLVERVIGAGGQGVVYLARTPDSRQVVLKMLNAASAHDPEAVARFEREARQLEAVSHENIVKMLGHGHALGRAFIAMEYIRGESLRDVLSTRGALALPQFVPIAAQILKAVGHVHSRGIMVRDIKPANIMLCRHRGRDNFVKLLDFGLAKLVGEQDAITTSHFVGTIGYLSPEQIQGLPFGLRVDVFALGVLFYHCLSGKLPFRGDTPEGTLYATVHSQPTPLAEVLPASAQMPPELEDLIMRCIDQDPARRPAHADEVVEGLIDAVPSSMFRLPKANGPITSTETTGRVRLDEHRDRSTAPPAGVREAAKSDSTAAPPVAVTAPEFVAAAPVPATSHAGRVGAIATAAAVLAGAVAWFVARGESTPPSEDRGGEVVEASLPADPSPSTLEVSVEPSATISIDGEVKGIDPGALELSPGPHEVRAEATGYQPWSKAVVIEPGKALALQIALTPEFAAAPAPTTSAPPRPEVAAPEPTPRARASRTRSRGKRRPNEAPKPATRDAVDENPETRGGTNGGAIVPGDMPRRRTKQTKTRALDENVW
ncbi:MAG: serine/threonine-protein kinase [Nannocystaceae bacterium]|nr:protein kinase [bacterium]